MPSNVDAAKIIAKGIAQDVRKRDFIPVSFADDLKKKFVTRRTLAGAEAHQESSKTHYREVPMVGAGGSESIISEAEAELIVARSYAVPRAYRRYYFALIDTIGDVLNEPKIRVERAPDPESYFTASREVTLNLAKYGGGRNISFILTSGQTVSTRAGQWKRFSRGHWEQKRSKKKRFYQKYWKHSGDLMNAYNREASAEKARLGNDLKHFLNGEPKIELYFSPSGREGRSGKSKLVSHQGKTCYAIEVTVRAKIPSWRPGAANLDKVVTMPLAGIRSSISASEAKAASNADLAGDHIQTIIAAEYRRPWIRRLSYLAGEEMRKYLNTLR